MGLGRGGVLAIPMLGRDWATELLQTALRVPQTGRNQQRLSCSESCCRKGFRRWEGPVWVCPYKVDIHRSLEAGGPPSLLPQAPGVREQKSITIWLPFGGPWLFSAQLRHIGEREGLVWLGVFVNNTSPLLPAASEKGSWELRVVTTLFVWL